MFTEIVTLTLLSISIFMNQAPPQPQPNKPIPDVMYIKSVNYTTPTPTAEPAPTATPEPTSTPTPTFTPTPTDTPTPTPTPIAAPVDLEALFTKYSNEYSVDKDLLKRIADCESHFNSEAVNGDYIGMFQFATSSWSSTRSAMGLDTNPDLRRNSEEAIRTTAFKIANGGQSSWPNCN